MNKPKYNCLTVFLGLTFLFSNSTLAVTFTCTSSGLDLEVLMPGYYQGRFDVVNSQCKTLFDENWHSFNMKKGDWVGAGYHNICNKYTPLNRTLRALELLRISKNPDLNKDVLLNKAYDYSKAWIKHLSPSCEDNSRNDNLFLLGIHIPNSFLEDEAAKEKLRENIINEQFLSITGRVLGEETAKEILTAEVDNRTDPGSGFVFITQNMFANPIIVISASILHEARHKKILHDGGKGCPRGDSCDTSFGIYGANAIELHYSWRYGTDSKNSTQFTRGLALDYARYLQNNAFNIPPTYNIPIIAK
jgi:hypothetical protein